MASITQAKMHHPDWLFVLLPRIAALFNLFYNQRFLSMSFSNRFEASAKWLKHTASALCIGGSLLLSQAASATTVQFQTVLGDFEVNLFDKTTPQTVANFLAYVNEGAYKNTIFHRSVPTL